MATLSRNERERRRLNAVFNATGDMTLARRARGWSDARIRAEIGVVVPMNRTPDRDVLSADQIKRRQVKYRNYRYALDIGIQTRDITALGYEKINAIEPTIIHRARSRRRLSLIEMNTEEYRASLARGTTVRDRYEMWTRWGKDKALPSDLFALARQINRDTEIEEMDRDRANGIIRRRRVSVNSEYGFVVVFHMFVYGEQYSEVKKTFFPDPWDIYRVYGGSGGGIRVKA